MLKTLAFRAPTAFRWAARWEQMKQNVLSKKRNRMAEPPLFPRTPPIPTAAFCLWTFLKTHGRRTDAQYTVLKTKDVERIQTTLLLFFLETHSHEH